ncbi:uncharacterized protein CEXT_487891 [Caerostris extrusa]|uniref:Uncharacterized protein n=1 Tax=Caerostris extrusa TaxID=172846 RepID=A0AAV4SWN4_CAEEX|nr:uncharacterized protein CEXT_487891 [Caerostris extrusa]
MTSSSVTPKTLTDSINTKESENLLTTKTNFKATTSKSKERHLTENSHRSSVFNRKFAFIHNEDNNGTNLYTTPIPANIQLQTKSYLPFKNNETEQRINLDRNIPFSRPDLKTFDKNHPHHVPSDHHVYGNDRWQSVPRTDPFSAVRNPYSLQNTGTLEFDRNSDRNKGYDSHHHINNDRIHPLPLNPQRNTNPKPLEILDHPSQRHDRHPGYSQGRPTSNYPRPVEIPNPQDRNPYPTNRYDYNRPISQPRPADISHQPNNPQPWNNNHNRVNTRSPPRGVNRPEETQVHRQPYPQQPAAAQNPQRNDDTWRMNPSRPSNSNSQPGRNNFYASQPQFRPSEVIATTQKSVQKKSLCPSYIAPRPETVDEDKVCTSKATVIATAVSVTLVYLGVVAGAVVGYRWHRKK